MRVPPADDHPRHRVSDQFWEQNEFWGHMAIPFHFTMVDPEKHRVFVL